MTFEKLMGSSKQSSRARLVTIISIARVDRPTLTITVILLLCVRQRLVASVRPPVVQCAWIILLFIMIAYYYRTDITHLYCTITDQRPYQLKYFHRTTDCSRATGHDRNRLSMVMPFPCDITIRTGVVTRSCYSPTIEHNTWRVSTCYT